MSPALPVDDSTPAADDAKTRLLSDLTGKACSGAAAARDEASRDAVLAAVARARAAVGRALRDGLDAAPPPVRDGLARLDAATADVRASAAAFAADRRRVAAAKLTAVKDRLVEAIESRARTRIRSGLDALRQRVTDAVVDPFMPGVVRRAVESVVDTVWPDIEEELCEMLLHLIHPAPPPPNDEVTAVKGWCCCLCLPRMVAAVRYFMWPHDKSVWQQAREPLWVVAKLVLLIPGYGVQQVYYLGVLLCIDRGDEYQLVQYILGFKAILFVTLGLLGTAIGAFRFYLCSQEITGQSENPTCSDTAPRESLPTVAAYVLQIVLVWTAFLFIPGSARKGGGAYQRMRARQEEEEAAAAAAGGDGDEGEEGEGAAAGSADAADNAGRQRRRRRLSKRRRRASAVVLGLCDAPAREKATQRRLLGFLVYDVCTVLLCVAILAYYVFSAMPTEDDDNHTWTEVKLNGSHVFLVQKAGREGAATTEDDADFFDDLSVGDRFFSWRFEVTLYMTKCLYGLLSFPFFFLKLPVLGAVLTHAKPTAYTKGGHCVPYKGGPQVVVADEEAAVGTTTAASGSRSEGAGVTVVHVRSSSQQAAGGDSGGEGGRGGAGQEAKKKVASQTKVGGDNNAAGDESDTDAGAAVHPAAK